MQLHVSLPELSQRLEATASKIGKGSEASATSVLPVFPYGKCAGFEVFAKRCFKSSYGGVSGLGLRVEGFRLVSSRVGDRNQGQGALGLSAFGA